MDEKVEISRIHVIVIQCFLFITGLMITLLSFCLFEWWSDIFEVCNQWF